MDPLTRLIVTAKEAQIDFIRDLNALIQMLFHADPAVGVIIFNTGGNMALNPTVPDNHAPFNATLAYLDAQGNPATPDTTPTWASDNEDVATVQAADDGMTAVVTLTGQLGAAIISASETETGADAPILAQGTITVIGSDAVTAKIDFDVEQSPANP